MDTTRIQNVNEQENTDQIEEIEVSLLLEGIYRRYGYDFRGYSAASMQRRIWRFIGMEKVTTISGLLERILHDPLCMERFVVSVTVNVTSMFRDPDFYVALREQVVPLLKTYPVIRIWDVGCCSGEEAYSVAIVLKEEGVYDKCRIYATDLNDDVLRKAKSGIMPLSHMKEYTDNYIRSGGKRAFSDYYTAKFDHAIIDHSLKKNIIFAQHNLVTDGSFNEFNLVLVRNVLIYFNDELRDRVLDLLHGSLSLYGVLALGKRETLRFTKYEGLYEELNGQEKIYKRYA